MEGPYNENFSLTGSFVIGGVLLYSCSGMSGKSLARVIYPQVDHAYVSCSRQREVTRAYSVSDLLYILLYTFLNSRSRLDSTD